MKVLDVTVKSIREALRQPKNLAITLGLPVVFMAIFGFAFGQGDVNDTYALAVVNGDEGDLGDRYVEGLRELTYDDGTPLLEVTGYERAEDAREPLERRTEDALVVIPPDFTEGLTPTVEEEPTGNPLQPTAPRRGAPPGTHVEMTGDPGFVDYGVVTRIVDAYTREFAAEATGEAPAIEVRSTQVTSEELTMFDRIAPGLMVFAILNMVPQAAAILAREVETGTLDRVRQSPTGALTVLSGVTLAQLALACLSMFLMLASAELLGFHNQGSYVVAYAVAMGAALASIGLGMVVAAFSKDPSEAGNVGALISVPVSFLSGAFFGLPPIHLFTWGGRDVGLYDLIPTTHAVDAMRAVLTFGRDTGDVAESLVALAVLGVAAFLVGAALYRRNRFVAA